MILLANFSRLAPAKTAHALAVPVGTVRSRLNRARRKLRAALGVTGPAESEEESRHE